VNPHITAHRAGFPAGRTVVTRTDDAPGIGFGVLRLEAGSTERVDVECETAWLLMNGALRVRVDGVDARLERRSLFDESASAVHGAAGSTVTIEAIADTEMTVYETANRRPFAARVFQPSDVPDEFRGKGQVRDRSLRFVRTIFDRRNSPGEAELVLGEVVTLPGGWSSYPPHHHPQPEIYHYRFTEPQGYGHAELGETVLKVRHNDVVCIGAGLDHAQCAAPGYGMYYAWVIRHLPGNPYTVPEFAPEHAWTMAPGSCGWWPRKVDDG
jgi:5-deoxy-glucuronate isomerase